MALDYRYTFASDVVIDLIGYRRHGHSEVDDPTITQPLLYKAIKDHPPLWKIYAEDADIDDVQPRADVIKRTRSRAKSRRQRPQETHSARIATLLGPIHRRTLQAAIRRANGCSVDELLQSPSG